MSPPSLSAQAPNHTQPIPLITSRTSSTSTTRIPDLTPQEYIEAISFHAKQTTRHSAYPGQNFEDLAPFLQRNPTYPYLGNRPNGHRRSPNSVATLYSLHKTTGSTGTIPTANSAGICRRIDHLDRPSQLPQLLQLTSNGDSNPGQNNNVNNDNANNKSHMLFLAGHPTPEWLATIGSSIQVDPQHYERHLSFLSRQSYFANPSLPSAAENIIVLRFITIGRRNSKGNSQYHIDCLRKSGAQQMGDYQHSLKLSREENWRPGDSIVRCYSVHDDEHFSIEQEISISLNNCGKQWIALVLLDVGNDLVESFRGPWLTEEDWADTRGKTTFLPIIRHRPKLALKSKRYTLPPEDQGSADLPHVASLLRRNYGNLLDWPTMKADPFYALHEIFECCAASELQFLNLVENRLSRETSYEALLAKDTVSLSNLLYTREILQAHTQRLEENLEKIKCRGSSQWPHPPENSEPGKKAKEAADVLLRDYEFLLAKAQNLAQRCERSMTVIMNNANIAESHRAMEQAKRVGKLTMLAFFYVPLSFTASFFGMNFEQFGAGPYLGIWVWFVVTVPVMIMSIAFYRWNISALMSKSSPLHRLKCSWKTMRR